MYQLDPLQQKCFDDTLSFLERSKRHGICVYSGGGGKSVMGAKIAEHLSTFGRVAFITHRKELLDQNKSKLSHDSVGMVSASLSSYEYDAQITIGGIATIFNKAENLGEIDYILVDECQRISNNPSSNSMYWQLIKAYPNARVIGFTALPMRLLDGLLTWGTIYHITTYKDLLDAGYITPMSNKPLYNPDTSNVKRNSRGDFDSQDFIKKCFANAKNNESYDKALIDKTTKQTYEIFTQNKLNKLLAFAPSVQYAKILAHALHIEGFKIWSKDGLPAVLESGMKKSEREEVLRRYKVGEYNALMNVEIATEGFDDPEIDLIACWRGTESLSLFQQIEYRGVRLLDPSIRNLPTAKERIEAIAKSKKPKCYFLDYAGNFKRHGGLIDTGWQSEGGNLTLAPRALHKCCPMCEEFVPISAKFCPECKYIFLASDEVAIEHDSSFDNTTDITKEKREESWYTVSEVEYEPNWISSKGNTMLRVKYKLKDRSIYQIIFNQKRRSFLTQRGWDGKSNVNWYSLKRPTHIFLIKNKMGYNEVTNYRW
jgi:DNA repair protein RadD